MVGKLHAFGGTWRRAALALVAVLALVTATTVIRPAGAAPNSEAEAQSQLISLDLFDEDALDVVTHYAEFTDGPSTDGGTVNLGLLTIPTIDIGSLQLPLIDGGAGGLLQLGTGAGAGLLNGYASTPSRTAAVAASGAVGNDGAIAVDTAPGDEMARVQLTEVLKQLGIAALTDEIIDEATLAIGAIASRAEAVNGVVDPSYLIADLDLELSVPLVTGLVPALGNAVDTVVAGLVGPTGALSQALAPLNTSVSLALVNLDLGSPMVSIDLDVETLVNSALATLASNGLVSIDLASGDLVIDLDALHLDGLNGLGSNTPLLNATTIGRITGAVTDLLGDVTDALAVQLVNAIEDAKVTLTFTPTVDAALNLVEGELTVVVDTTIGDILDGTVVASDITITGALRVNLPPIPLTLDAGNLTDLVKPLLLNTLIPALGAPLQVLTGDGAVKTLLDGVLDPVLDVLEPVLRDVLAHLLTITINRQPTEATNGFTATNGDLGARSFTVRALEIVVAPLLNDAVTLGLASSTVWSTSVAAPTATDITPAFGPLTGGTTVTITGTDFAEGYTSVTFGGLAGTDLDVVSPTELTVTTPPGVVAGPVDVTVATDGGSAVLEDGFTYVAAPVASTITPDHGPLAGGTVVTITGSGFLAPGGVLVAFGGEAGTDVTAVSDTELQVTTPAGVDLGPVNVLVSTSGGPVTIPDGFTYVAGPSISALAPTFGPLAGGTSVVITGSGFLGATDVVFGTNPAASFMVVSDTEIAAVSPPGDAVGPVEVTVETPIGTSAPGTFTYLPVPVVTSLDPTVGPQAGGTPVTITGSGFTGATQVAFGANPATSFAVVSDVEMTAISPAAAAPGPVEVIVTTGGGASGPGSFTYVPAPVVDGINPDEGPLAGGTLVTIVGEHLEIVSEVTFDGVPGTDLTIVGDGEITIVTPPGAAPGPVDVAVTSLGGTTTNVDGFTYLPAPGAPTTTGINPGEGPLAGGTTVTITGTGFTDATGVTFGAHLAASFTVDSDTQITAVTPAGDAAGTVDVRVSNDAGASEPQPFTYISNPIPSAVDPDEGPLAGGTSVTITGTGFTSVIGVLFGAHPATSFTVDSDTQITAVSPPGDAVGPVELVLSTVLGDSDPLSFTYRAAPVVSDLDPTSGPVSGGTAVTITGSGFIGASGVTFDGVSGADLVVVSDTEISVVTPAGAAPGAVDVVVTAPGGVSAPGEFTYLAAPVIPEIDGISPSAGPVTGGTTVTITGADLDVVTEVTFDGVPGTDLVHNVDGSITVVTPPGAAPGAVDVVLVAPDGPSAPGVFTYISNPVPTAVDPDEGPLAGGTTVTITGTGFTSVTGVSFGAHPATSFTVDSDTQITAVSPPGDAVGPVELVLSTVLGDSDPLSFTYRAAPVVSGLDPTSGPVAGGTTVTITGTGFTGASGVIFDDELGRDLVVVSDTEITVVTPAGTAPGVVDVVVIAPGGASEPQPFTYISNPIPSAVVPEEGPLAGGTSVTITGTGFTSVTGVSFGAHPATSFTVVSGTEITAVSPAGDAAGPVELVLSTVLGDSNALAFTYLATPVIPATDGISPTAGPVTGGTTVTILGEGFTGVSGVTFDGVPGTGLVVESDTEITVVTPAGAAPGAVEVVVTGPDGSSEPGVFTYTAVAPVTPVIDEVSPAEGPTAGGTPVTVTGEDLDVVTEVRFDGVPGTDLVHNPDGSITVVTPPGVGLVDITFHTPEVTVTEPDAFTYIDRGADAPVIDEVSPDQGPGSGGTRVTITGDNLEGVTEVTFNGVPGTNLVHNPDGSITVTTPPGAGRADVTVRAGNQAYTAPGAFTYVAASTTVPSTTSTTARQVTPTTTPGRSSGMARTGANIALMASIGGLLVVAGAALVRRRQES